MRMLKRLIGVALVMGILVAMIGCNTTEGIGEDVERAGEKVQDVAK